MRLFVVMVLVLGLSGRLQAAIVPVYEGSNGIRGNVLTVCMQCHSTTLSGAARNNAPAFINFNTYADAILWADNAVAQANARTMPPAGNTPLNSEQRAALGAWQAAGFPEKSASVQDTQAPTTPAGLTATAISTSAINLAWASSTDNVGVSAYKVLRGGAPIATLGNVTSYVDKDLSAATAYSYIVTACDAAGNCSSPSAAATAATMQNVAGNPNQQADCLLDWAEGKFPDFFAPRSQSLSAAPYYYRFYPPGTYLAIASDKVFYLGPLSSNTVLEVGDVATWYAHAGCR